MFKKMLCLASLALVFGLVGSASADLVVHWSLEDGSGTVATDVSGNGNDGTFNGAPEWVDGYFGGGLHFRGDADADSVVYSLPGGAAVWQTGTIALWVKADSLGQDNWSSCFTNYTPNSAGVQFDVDGGNPGNYRLNPGGQFFGPATTEWTHLALAFEAGTGTFYYNGAEATTAALSDSQRTFNEFALGINRNHTNWLASIIDELRIYDHALAADEIQAIMESAGGGLPLARRPDPKDGAMFEQTWANLSWTPGDFAVSHDLYFGTNFDDVNEGAEATFVGNTLSTFQVVGFPGFPESAGLQPGTTYYWRVDEVNDADPNSPWKGYVWSFFIPPRKAYDPQPADGTGFAFTDATLSWTPGFDAKLHHVYFGENLEDVNNGTGGTYKGPAADATYNPGSLERGKVYYWRIDEFDGAATQKGDVWSFGTIPVMAISDPSLVGWWKLDEGSGATVVDYSGYDHHGTIRGSTFWTEGYDLGSLEFTGAGDYVEMIGYVGVTGTNPRTTTAWIRTTTPNRTIISWGLNVAGQKWRVRSDATGGLRAEVNGGYNYGVTNITDGLWHHVAVTFEDDGTPDALDLKLYVDGQMDATADIQDEPIDTAATGVVRIGESPWHNAPFVGLIDDVRIYDKALTQEEIQLVMRIDPLLAWFPKPTDGATVDIDNATPLSWSRGDNASQHDVYLGTDKDAVANADASDTTGIYRGSQSGTSYTPQDIAWGGGPYYWRI
ncbi:MAG: LamG-like jellyroll fold domain-containing protein, partial [Planctomycetota bacterium]